MFGMVVLGLVLGALFTVGAACLWSRRHPNKPMLSLLGNQGPMPGLPPLANPASTGRRSYTGPTFTVATASRAT